MGLFGRKQKHDDETDNGSEAPTAPPEENIAAPAKRAEAAKPKPRRSGSAASKEVKAGRYGVHQVMELMRDLPVDQNQDLVAHVVRRTLESAAISIATIIDDATGKQEDIKKRIDTLTQAISEMKQEIATRRQHVADLQTELAEVTRVKELLTKADEATEPHDADAEGSAKAGDPADG